ncbi:MAG: hypothetical protein SOT81_02005 [Treponema sp.]|nr:hypothetical protein [Treponema sp.]
MKKNLITSLLFFVFLSRMLAGDISIFDGIELPYFVYFNKTKYTPIAYFEYDDKNNYFVGYDGSGYAILTTDLYERDDVLYVEFIKIWNGAEEVSKTDRRKIYKYCVALPRQTIIKGEEIFNIEPVFIAEDTRGGVPGVVTSLFFSNSIVSVRNAPAENAKELFSLAKGSIFKLEDIVCSSKEIWIKLSIPEKGVGYIPFSCLAADWGILKSELPSKD